MADYTKGLRENKALFDGTLQGGWTMDEANFCAQNVVALSLTLWCSSSESRAQDDAVTVSRYAYPNGLPPEALRPVTIFSSGLLGETTVRSGASNVTLGSGHLSAYAGMTPSNAAAAITVSSTFRADRFLSRARIFSDRIVVDNRTTALPYTVRQVEVSVTVLTPQGSRELRGLQLATGSATFAETTTSTFRRIVHQHGRSFSRRIQVLGTGG